MEKLEYKYRIVKRQNGLGEVHYQAECLKVLPFLKRIIIKEVWEEIHIPNIQVPKVLLREEKLQIAKEQIQEHKERNIWIEEILTQ